ncbi:hypothetical protein [Tenacibaculum soleae]|uniref:hypothetical protein n=1 Tax=Tenacibaculum soleae TaxID=447689 RepID=UPI0023002BF2|nr:hypothetical protein [Tenacibaculum soleae]
MSDEITKKCICGTENKITCPRCSVLKMAIMLKNKQQHLKYAGPNGKLSNPVWYNHLSKNRKPIDNLMRAMLKRFLNSEYATVTNCVIFYDNKTKNQLSTFKI